MADYYIAISHKIKEVLVNDGIPDLRIFVVHSGIDPQRFVQATVAYLLTEFDINENQKVVINVAHLADHKGQIYLVWVILHVLVKLPDTRFFIVGQGEWMDELKGTASELGFKREFVFTGFRDDVADFYQIADLFVMSSVQEGLGTAVLDSVGKAADEIVVVDSYSTDKTKEICNCLNVKFLQHAFEGHVEQKKYAVSCASYGHVL